VGFRNVRCADWSRPKDLRTFDGLVSERTCDEPSDERWFPLARRGAHIRRLLPTAWRRFVVSFIGYAEVLENLANAPSVRLGMLVELRRVHSGHDRGNSLARLDCLGAQLLVELALCRRMRGLLTFQEE